MSAVVTASGVPAGRGVPPVREAAVRRRRRGWLWVVAVLLVAFGGLAAAVLVGRAGGRVAVLAVARTVRVGQTVSTADLVVARVPADPVLRPVPAADRTQVVGAVAAVELRPGTLVTRADLSGRLLPAVGQQLVGLPLRDGQWPARGLAPGDRVLVVPVPADQSTASAPPAVPVGEPVPATVVGLGVRGEDGLTTVDVAVAADVGPTVAATASTGRLAVVLLPAGG